MTETNVVWFYGGLIFVGIFTFDGLTSVSVYV